MGLMSVTQPADFDLLSGPGWRTEQWIHLAATASQSAQSADTPGGADVQTEPRSILTLNCRRQPLFRRVR
jgi:hypothetical protein